MQLRDGGANRRTSEIKDMLASFMKFKAALDEQKARAENTLPEFYKNVKYQVYIS